MKLEKTCFNKFRGTCEGCEKNYNPDKHQNNQDCKKYYEVHIGTFVVIERK